MLRSLLGNSLLFSKSDAIWKAKRKAIAHAFYKDRLAKMLDVLKTETMVSIKSWLAKISTDGEV